jgi:hypothetical protein
MLYKLGRSCQVIGMFLLPLAVAGNLADQNRMDLRTSLTISGIGVTIFIIGYMLQQAGKKA